MISSQETTSRTATMTTQASHGERKDKQAVDNKQEQEKRQMKQITQHAMNKRTTSEQQAQQSKQHAMNKKTGDVNKYVMTVTRIDDLACKNGRQQIRKRQTSDEREIKHRPLDQNARQK